MSQSQKEKRINGNAPILSQKLDYVFGKATGRQHNLDRSLGMLRQLKSIGIHDTPTSRADMATHLKQVFHDQNSIASENGNWIKRESLLAGPGGFLKVESTWKGPQLITIVLKGGKGG